MEKKSKDLLTVSEFCERFRMTKYTVYRLIREDKIPYYRIYGVIRLDPEDFKNGVRYE